jgi:hypothetical protein
MCESAQQRSQSHSGKSLHRVVTPWFLAVERKKGMQLAKQTASTQMACHQ